MNEVLYFVVNIGCWTNVEGSHKRPLHGLENIARYHKVAIARGYQPPKVEDMKFRLDAIERLLFAGKVIEIASFYYPNLCPAAIIKEYLESKIVESDIVQNSRVFR
jgi:hypothetical protein